MTTLKRLRNFEDQFTERKEQGVSYEAVCKTLVAFANSLEAGQTGILFIGVSDKGEITGVQNPEKRMKWITNLAHSTCYPPIPIKIEVLTIEEKQVIAVVVDSSENRPHFAGPAYVRVGSQSLAANENQYQTLLASRISPVRELAKARDSKLQVIVARPYPSLRTYCIVTSINPVWVEFQSLPSGDIFSIPTTRMLIRWDGTLNKLLVTEI